MLFIEAKRFTEEQKEMISRVKLFLGDEALQYMISVFSHCSRKQASNPEYLKKSSWNEPVRAFVNSVGNRWAISPNPDIFPPDSLMHKQRLKELQNHIISIDGVYTNEVFEKARKDQEENARIAREAEEKRQREYDELKKREGEAIARANYEKQKAEDERKANEKYNKELQNVKTSLLEQINNLNKKVAELTKANDVLSGKNREVRVTHPASPRKSSNPESDLTASLKRLAAESEYETRRFREPSYKCFWPETQVRLESGRIIKMSELQVGDRVLSNIRNGIAEFSNVYLIAHIGKLDHEAKFTKVSFTRPDRSKGNLF
jgi:hypothetical protein